MLYSRVAVGDIKSLKALLVDFKKTAINQLNSKVNKLNITLFIALIAIVIISLLMASSMIKYSYIWVLCLCAWFWFISPHNSKAESISLYFFFVFFSFMFWLPILARLPFSPLPIQDNLLHLIESPIQGIYIPIVDYINHHHTLESIFFFLYDSVQYYLVIGVIYAFIFEHKNLKKFVFIFALLILIASIISYLLPVASPVYSYGKAHYNHYMNDLFYQYIQMRKGVDLTVYDDITMPSWHYLFVLCAMTLASKNTAKILYHLYGYMILFSVVLLGCHYFADMVVSVLLFLFVMFIYNHLSINKKSIVHLHKKRQISQKINVLNNN